MALLNTFQIFGNVVAAPVLRKTPGHVSTVTYIVEVKDDTGTGRKKGLSDFIPVTTYGNQAEKDASTLVMGSVVGVRGTIHSWWNPKAKKGGVNFVAEKAGVIYIS